MIVVSTAEDEDHERGLEDPPIPPARGHGLFTVSEETSTNGPLDEPHAAVRKEHGHLSDIVEAMDQREEAAAGGFGVMDVREVEAQNDALSFHRPHDESRGRAAGPSS